LGTTSLPDEHQMPVEIDTDALRTAEEIAKPCEGFRARPYLCPAGVWAKGYGSTFNPDGTPVKPTDPPITEPEAAGRLRGLFLTVFIPGTQKLVPHLTGEELGAIADFSFNLGLTRLAGSTLRKKLLAGDLEGARQELAKWVRGGGRVLPGLVLRRRLEASRLRQLP
jgi:lysozyme